MATPSHAKSPTNRRFFSRITSAASNVKRSLANSTPTNQSMTYGSARKQAQNKDGVKGKAEISKPPSLQLLSTTPYVYWNGFKQDAVPTFLVTAFNFIVEHGLNTEGLFRKEGNSLRCRELYEQLLKDRPINQLNFSVIDVCSTIKKFLREIEPPLLCDTGDELIKIYTTTNQRVRSSMLLEMGLVLNRHHRCALIHIARMLQYIAKNQTCETKMSISALATVFVPSIFRDDQSPLKLNSISTPDHCISNMEQANASVSIKRDIVETFIKLAHIFGVRTLAQEILSPNFYDDLDPGERSSIERRHSSRDIIENKHSTGSANAAKSPIRQVASLYRVTKEKEKQHRLRVANRALEQSSSNESQIRAVHFDDDVFAHNLMSNNENKVPVKQNEQLKANEEFLDSTSPVFNLGANLNSNFVTSRSQLSTRRRKNTRALTSTVFPVNNTSPLHNQQSELVMPAEKKVTESESSSTLSAAGLLANRRFLPKERRHTAPVPCAPMLQRNRPNTIKSGLKRVQTQIDENRHRIEEYSSENSSNRTSGQSTPSRDCGSNRSSHLHVSGFISSRKRHHINDVTPKRLVQPSCDSDSPACNTRSHTKSTNNRRMFSDRIEPPPILNASSHDSHNFIVNDQSFSGEERSKEDDDTKQQMEMSNNMKLLDLEQNNLSEHSLHTDMTSNDLSNPSYHTAQTSLNSQTINYEDTTSFSNEQQLPNSEIRISNKSHIESINDLNSHFSDQLTERNRKQILNCKVNNFFDDDVRPSVARITKETPGLVHHRIAHYNEMTSRQSSTDSCRSNVVNSKIPIADPGFKKPTTPHRYHTKSTSSRLPRLSSQSVSQERKLSQSKIAPIKISRLASNTINESKEATNSMLNHVQINRSSQAIASGANNIPSRKLKALQQTHTIEVKRLRSPINSPSRTARRMSRPSVNHTPCKSAHSSISSVNSMICGTPPKIYPKSPRYSLYKASTSRLQLSPTKPINL